MGHLFFILFHFLVPLKFGKFMLEIIIIAMAVASLNWLWFRTYFFTEYVSLTPFTKKFFLVNQWEQWRQEEFEKRKESGDHLPEYSYLMFLSHTRGNRFIVRLLSCPFCFGMWASLIFSLVFIIFPFIVNVLAVYFLATIFYFLNKKFLG